MSGCASVRVRGGPSRGASARRGSAPGCRRCWSAPAVLTVAGLAAGSGRAGGHRTRSRRARRGPLPGRPPGGSPTAAGRPAGRGGAGEHHDRPPAARSGTGGSPTPGPPEVDPAEAEEFLRMFHAENPGAGPVVRRLAQVLREIDETGTYWHTPEELAFGARAAWRNSSRCIGRLYWRSLQVRDLRTVANAAGVARRCIEHLDAASQGGKIRPMISVFAPDTPARRAPRIWNEQLIRYAGYDLPDGSVLGDPRYREFTGEMIRRGWRPPEPRGAFDVLPLIVETVQEGPRMFALPEHARARGRARAPRAAVVRRPGPALARGAGDQQQHPGRRRGVLPGGTVQRLVHGDRGRGPQPRRQRPLRPGPGGGPTDGAGHVARGQPVAGPGAGRAQPRGAALLPGQGRVHHRPPHRVPPVPHAPGAGGTGGRSCPADWSWIVPPLSGSQTPVFHRYYETEDLLPNFFADDDAVQRAVRGGPPAFG